MIDPKNCNYIILVEYIGSANKIIPPILLISKVNILHKWCQHNNLDGNIMISIIETGYTNNNTVLKWLQYFINHIQNKRQSI